MTARKYYVRLAEHVIDQTERRMLHGESVPAPEKIVSIFAASVSNAACGGRPGFARYVGASQVLGSRGVPDSAS